MRLKLKWNGRTFLGNAGAIAGSIVSGSILSGTTLPPGKGKAVVAGQLPRIVREPAA